MVSAAQQGDEAAARTLARMASETLYQGGEMHPSLVTWLAGALARYGRGEANLNHSFAPMKRPPKGIPKARRSFNEMAISYWVDRAIEQGLSTGSDTGEPGPAFEYVAEAVGLAASTVRDIYYRYQSKGRE